MAAPPANPQGCFGTLTSFLFRSFCAYFIVSSHYYLQRKQERRSKRHSPHPRLVPIKFLWQPQAVFLHIFVLCTW